MVSLGWAVSPGGAAAVWPAVSLLRAACLPVFAALVSAEAGDNGVSFSVYSGSGSTAFPCRFAVCLRDGDVEMGAAY